jgi:hypothetical protein
MPSLSFPLLFLMIAEAYKEKETGSAASRGRVRISSNQMLSAPWKFQSPRKQGAENLATCSLSLSSCRYAPGECMKGVHKIAG